MPETKVIVIPEGKICDYVDGKFRNTHRRSTLDRQLKSVLLMSTSILLNKSELSTLCNWVQENLVLILLFLIIQILSKLKIILS